MPTVERWARVEEFNPNSAKQVMEYLKFRGYKIYKTRDQPPKETANIKALEKTLRLVYLKGNKDLVLENVIEARKLQKAIGYLLEANLGADSMYHPIYTFKPETGRLSAIRPNIMNQPNHGVDEKVARAIRSCIIPSQPDRILLEVDWKAMEAVLTGYFAQDEDFIKISQIDSHTYFLAFILKNEGTLQGDILEPADPALSDWLKGLKKQWPDKRFMAKTANLAMGYDIGWSHLAEVVRCSAKEAKAYLKIRDEMFPKVAAWKMNTFREAHAKGYLETPFGYRAYYWNVLEQVPGKPKGVMKKGKEARDALAFRPQSTGAAMLRETMLDMAQHDGTLFYLLAPIHDALFVEVERKKLAKAVQVIKASMERKWVELGGLSIEAEASIGESWADMEAYV